MNVLFTPAVGGSFGRRPHDIELGEVSRPCPQNAPCRLYDDKIERALEKKFQSIIKRKLPNHSRQARRATVLATVGGTLGAALAGGIAFDLTRLANHKQRVLYQGAKNLYCAQFKSFSWMQTISSPSGDAIYLANVPANLQTTCLTNFGTEFRIDNPFPVDARRYGGAFAGPFPRQYDPAMPENWAEPSFYVRARNSTSPTVVSQGIHSPNTTGAKDAPAIQIESYCAQFTGFVWVQPTLPDVKLSPNVRSDDASSSSGESVILGTNVPVDLSPICRDNFGGNKTITNPHPASNSGTWNIKDVAGPFPLTPRWQTSNDDFEFRYYTKIGTTIASDVASMGLFRFDSREKIFTPAAMGCVCAVTGIIGAMMLFGATKAITLSRYRRAQGICDKNLRDEIEEFELFAPRIAAAETFVVTRLPVLRPLVDKESFLTLISDAISARVRQSSRRDFTREEIWFDATKSLLSDLICRWTEDKLEHGQMLSMAAEHPDTARSLAQIFNSGEQSLRDFSSWQYCPEKIHLYDAFLKFDYADNKEALSVVRRMAFLNAPSLPLRHPLRSFSARRAGEVYQSLHAQAVALLPQEKTPRDYFELHFGSNPSFAVISAHGDHGMDPATSLRRTTETLEGALTQAWRTDGRKIGEDTHGLFEALRSTGCSEAKVRALCEYLADKAINVDAISKVEEIWREFDEGQGSIANVIAEHVRYQYVLAWQRYAKDFGLPRKLTQALAVRISSDSLFSKAYFSPAIVKEKMMANDLRIAELPRSEIDALLHEQEALGLF